MRKLRNVLYVTNPLSYLSCEGESISVSVENQVVARVPLLNLEGVVCFGFMGVSPALMELCTSHDVSLCFVSPYGKFLGRVCGRVSGNVLLRKKQYSLSDDESLCVEVARNFILGKILNCRYVLQRFLRDHPDAGSTDIKNALEKLSEGVSELRGGTFTLNELRGVEGRLSRVYFDCFDELILSSEPEFSFTGRNRRPPLDRVNALLSFVYTLIGSECGAACESVGLDPQVGFLHRVRPGRSSLALDLMEEFRPVLGDRFVLSLINNRVVKAGDFMVRENGAVVLSDDARREVLKRWQVRKNEVVTHPFLDEKVETGLLVYAQALLLARFLRGDIDGYPPFVVR